MDSAPFNALLDRYQSGEATAEELGELDRQLRADAGKRRMLVERTLLEVHLRKFFGGLAPAPMQRRAPRSDRPRWAIVAAGVVLVVLGLCVLAGLLRNAGGPGAAVESGVVRVNNVATAIVPMQTPFEVGGQIPAVLRLPDGAHVELDPGTRAIAFGASGQAGRRIELARGGGTFAVAAEQAPLHIETPAGTVVAGSARFSARLAKTPNGITALTVAVSAGTVEVAANGQQQTLAAGQQREFAAPAGQ